MILSLEQFFASALFMLGYIAISLEHRIHTSKSAIALILGASLWLLVATKGGSDFAKDIAHAGSDIFGIVVFLLAAMSLVEVLIHYKFFDVVRGRLLAWHLSERKQFIVISALAFSLSAVIDNLTATIVMIQMARQFFRGENLLRVGAAIVIATNAGGAFSPIGDVTTIMLWLAGKFESTEIILGGFLPAVVLFIVATYLIYKKITPDSFDVQGEVYAESGRSEKIIIGLVFFSFVLPVIMNYFGLPPYLGLLLGLGLVWLTIDFVKQVRPRQSHLNASIEEMIRKTDIPSLKFFIGILLTVSALGSLGVLQIFSESFYGEEPSSQRIIAGNVGLGVLSAVLDNVPLTAIAIESLPTESSSLWVLLALTVGTGGSLLVIGSAAGVVAMGMLKELNFAKYVMVAFVPALVGYAAAVAIWCLQYFVFGI